MAEDDPFRRLTSCRMWEHDYAGYDVEPLNYQKRVDAIIRLETCAACRGTTEDLYSIRQRKNKLHEKMLSMTRALDGWWIQPDEEMVLS